MTFINAVETPWYDLFSRGARDWLRHNHKVREAVRQTLPEILAREDLMSRPGSHTVAVPVRFLEHARLRLAEPVSRQGVGQGQGQPGEALVPGESSAGDAAQPGGTGEGEVRFEIELKIDEIVDWLWQELKLPELKPRRGAALEEPDYVREGWDRRGARSRLDRRRTIKEAVKRRAAGSAVPIANDDLRFRQLVRRPRPSINAAVLFALDVSASMDQEKRRLAKQFFFFALQGLRRQYARVETVFLAHAAEAWEFDEPQFFQASSTGGTVASSVFRLALEVMGGRYPPASFNVYFFYASDGDNADEDRAAAAAALGELTAGTSYAGYLEPGDFAALRTAESQIGGLFRELKRGGAAVGSCALGSQEDVWRAIRELFSEQHEPG